MLATRDYGLTCVWSGRPHWFLQHMAPGEPIGFSTLITQNDGYTGLYTNQRNNCAGWTHIALMGDPTLRMHVVAPPANFAAESVNNGIALTWASSSDDSIEGYNVYRATSSDGPFFRLNAWPVTKTYFLDSNGASELYTYMVRAVKLETSASGTYLNLSEGQFTTSPAPQNIADTINPSTLATSPQEVALIKSINTAKLSPTGSAISSGH